MRRPALIAALALLAASLGTCAWAMRTAGEAVRPVSDPALGSMLDRAADAAQGLRVLAIVAKPGSTPTAEIYESARGAEGWSAYPPTPDPGDPLLPALRRLAAVAAADFADDRRFEEATAKALEILGVAVVAATDGAQPIFLDVGERDERVVAVPSVPGARLRHASPVFHFLAEEPSIDPADAVGYRRTWRGGDAQFLDYGDHAPWGGEVTIDSDRDAEYLLPWSAAGARVEIDGAPAAFRAARVPVIVVAVPAGRRRLAVRYGDQDLGRQWLAIASAAGVVAALIALWLGLRPRVEAPLEP